MRILDGLGISYEAAEYEDDGEHELAKGAALRMAEKLGVAPETVFKTIVMRTETKELLALTGYIRGGCTPIGMKKQFRTFIDETVILYDKICVSGGQRGVQIKLAPDDLILATGATVVDLEL